MKKLLSLVLIMCFFVSVFPAIAVNASTSGKMYQVKPYYTVDAFEISGSDSSCESKDVTGKTVYVDGECTLKAAEQVQISIYALKSGTTLQQFHEDLWDEVSLKFTMSPDYIVTTYPGYNNLPTSITLQKGTYAVGVEKGGNEAFTLVVVGENITEKPEEKTYSSAFEYLILPKGMTGTGFIPAMEKDTIIITKILDKDAETITIPESIDGYEVSGVDYNFLSGTEAVNLHLPSTFRFMWKVSEHSHNEKHIGEINHADEFITKNLKNIYVNESNPYHTSADGVLFSKDMSVLEIYPKERTSEIYTVPDGVKELAYGAFEDSENLEKVVLPKSMKKIGVRAFAGCKNLSECVIPDGVEFIGESAFHMCESLKSINVPRSVKELNFTRNSGNEYYLGYKAPTVIYYAGSPAEFGQIENKTDEKVSEIGLSKMTIYYAEEGNEQVNTPTEEEVYVEDYVHIPVAQYWNINDEILGVINKDFLEIRLTYGDIESATPYDGSNFYRFKNSPVAIFCSGVVNGADGYYHDTNGVLLPNPLDVCTMAYCNVGDLFYGLEDRIYTHTELSSHTGLTFKKEYGKIVTAINGVAIEIETEDSIKKNDPVRLSAEWSTTNKPIYKIQDIDIDRCTRKGIYYYSGETIVKIHESASGKIVIPNVIEGQRITKIGSKALMNNANVTEIIIEDGIEGIGEYAFYNMPNLAKVKMPKSLRVINDSAFEACGNLVSANIPTGVEKIGSAAFKSCSSLEFARIPCSVSDTGHDIFIDCNSLTTVAWLNNCVTESYVGFDGPIRNVILGKEMNMLPYAHFTPGGSVENLLITAPKIAGIFGYNYGSGLLNPENIWYTGEKKQIDKCIKDGGLLWKKEEVVSKCNPYEFPSLPEFIKDYDVVSVVLNGKILFPDKKPYIKNDRVLVPMRIIFEAMGMSVKWDNSTRTVTAKGNGNTVELQIGNKTAIVNGEEVEMDVPAEISGDRTMVPVRFVSESVGAKVEWIGEEKIVDIYIMDR